MTTSTDKALAGPVGVALEEGGALLRLTLQSGKGNVLDTAAIGALREALREARGQPAIRAVLLCAAGKHFSFGASVEEHLPHKVVEMLPAFHALFTDLLASGKALLCAVRGQCLGGGLELAAFCQRVFAAPDARLGQPEIKLGVMAPVASLVLPLRLGQGAADDLLLTGRTVDAEEALRLRLVDELAADPEAAALAWFRAHLLPLSAAALRHAVRAARHGFARALEAGLAELERQYLDDLMLTHDAGEGIAAFLEKRTPRWTHS